MSADNMAEDSRPNRHLSIWRLPSSGTGWAAVVLAVAIVPVAWVLMSHALPWELLDTAFAPILLVSLIDAAAVTAVLALFRRHDRSVFVVVSTVFAVPLAVCATIVLILEVIFPH